MRKEAHKIQIGDKLYEASRSYNKVFEWEILEIFLENYVSGTKTIVRCTNESWRKEFFASDVVWWYDTREEAEAEIRRRK
jgi:hypothetical protein